MRLRGWGSGSLAAAFAGESFGEMAGVAERMASVGVVEAGHIGDWVDIGLEPVVGPLVGFWISLQALQQYQHRVLRILLKEDESAKMHLVREVLKTYHRI